MLESKGSSVYIPLWLRLNLEKMKKKVMKNIVYIPLWLRLNGYQADINIFVIGFTFHYGLD